MKKTILLLALVLAPTLVFGQALTDLKDRPYVNGKTSLFDPSKLKMHQSYTLGYYSGAGGSGSVGYYLNSIEYNFSNPLKVRLDLGFLHNPSSILSGNSSRAGVFVPGVSLDWRPASSFHFMLDFRQMPAFNYGGYNGYFNPGYWEEYR
jgi:hypothetical protein